MVASSHALRASDEALIFGFSIVRTRFAAQAQGVLDLGLVSPVQ